ncbi:MAG: ABC transporter ATP-binding protein [Spirochaetaceae bacterium]|jgi:ABC-type nitrate/sulfonate/bicarbonate transport system ATPase subunit|nr:ABC transporter ATP-binding protein [Spirochaetaceae bacterium]
MAYIRIQDLDFRYGQEFILKDMSLDLEQGEFLALLGPSGCGKSTLLRLLAGLLFPQKGRISIAGRPVSGPGLDRAVVFQDYSLFPWMHCRDNVALALEQAGIGKTRRDRAAQAEEYLALVNLPGVGDKLPGELSGGMRQRIAIARALAQNAPILLMDEPFGALDEITRAHQQALFLNLWHSGGAQRKTVLFITHDVEEALLLSGRIILLGAPPQGIARDLTVDLPYPRSHRRLLDNPRFTALRNDLLDALSRVVLACLEGQKEAPYEA